MSHLHGCQVLLRADRFVQHGLYRLQPLPPSGDLFRQPLLCGVPGQARFFRERRQQGRRAGPARGARVRVAELGERARLLLSGSVEDVLQERTRKLTSAMSHFLTRSGVCTNVRYFWSFASARASF